jgi:Nif-specific regulatory protein
MDKPIHRIGTTAISMMMAYCWPGNVRELENCIEHAVVLSDDGVVVGHHLPPTLQMPEGTDRTASGSFKLLTSSFERDLITDALKRTGGNINAAARELGISAQIVRIVAQLSPRLPTVQFPGDQLGQTSRSVFREPLGTLKKGAHSVIPARLGT